MPDSNNHDSVNSPSPSNQTSKRQSWRLNFLIISMLGPVLAAVVLYQLDSFDPVSLPLHELSQRVAIAPKRNGQMLKGSEFLGAGALLKPEDIAYDSKSGLIYTGCADGWIKRVTLNESAADTVVENWVNTGGRPLGLAHGHNGELFVADAEKGLLKISGDGAVELLSDEAEGVKFKLTDFVDVAQDGMIYFTDATYKYRLKEDKFALLESSPDGRLLSYDPTTEVTKVLLHDLFFPNGVVVSPDQNFLIFCETLMRRCRKYYLQGEKKGSVENFIDNLPGLPDNIRYDGEGHYWIALPTEITPLLNQVFKYPSIRKWLLIIEKYAPGKGPKGKDSGVMAVNLEGEPIAHYSDPGLSMITTGSKIGKYLYCGSIIYPYIIRFHLEQHPALATTA